MGFGKGSLLTHFKAPLRHKKRVETLFLGVVRGVLGAVNPLLSNFTNDHLHEKLAKRGIKTIDIGKHSKFQLVNLSDLK